MAKAKAKKKKSEAEQAPLFRTQERVLEVRPVSKKRGGAKEGDEAVILQTTTSGGKRLGKGRVIVRKV